MYRADLAHMGDACRYRPVVFYGSIWGIRGKPQLPAQVELPSGGAGRCPCSHQGVTRLPVPPVSGNELPMPCRLSGKA